jgi:intraflagellar transport protein 140
VSQATSLAFHPQKQLLISGWENGEIHAWISGKREFVPIQGSSFHKSPIMLVEFSEKGGRLVTADSVSLIGIHLVSMEMNSNFCRMEP